MSRRKPPGRYEIQAWSGRDLAWTPMSRGPGGPWRNRDSPVEAAAKCLAWTGLAGIPAMRVVDSETGDVVWRFGHEEHCPEGCPPVVLPLDEETAAWQQAHDRLAAASAQDP